MSVGSDLALVASAPGRGARQSKPLMVGLPDWYTHFALLGNCYVKVREVFGGPVCRSEDEALTMAGWGLFRGRDKSLIAH